MFDDAIMIKSITIYKMAGMVFRIFVAKKIRR